MILSFYLWDVGIGRSWVIEVLVVDFLVLFNPVRPGPFRAPYNLGGIPGGGGEGEGAF